MNFLKYRNAEEFLQENGFDVETGLRIVEAELRRLKGD